MYNNFSQNAISNNSNFDITLLVAASRGIGNGNRYSGRYEYFTFLVPPHSYRSSTLNLKHSAGFILLTL